MAARPPKPLLNLSEDQQIIQKLKKTVELKIEECADGTELEVLDRELRPDRSVFNSHYNEVIDDLNSLLKSLHIERIDPFGSTVMGLELRG